MLLREDVICNMTGGRFHKRYCHLVAMGLMLKTHYTFSAYIILETSLY